MSTRTRTVARLWRRPPSVYSGREENVRHATWLELFFDLVFVVAVAELGGYLHEHLTLVDFLAFAGLFLLVWWVWLSYSYYADLFDTDDTVSRLALVVAMFVVIFLSQTIDGALHGESFAFGVAILTLRAIIAVLYLRARQMDGEERRFVHYLTVSNLLATSIVALSLLVPVPGRYGLWAAAVITNLAAVVFIYTVLDVVVVQSSHLPERLGLMTILVLGETVLGVSFGTSITAPGPVTLAVGALGFAIAVAAWWIYFERFDEHLIDRLLDPRDEHWRTARQRGLVYAFSHYFTHMGIVAAGVGITLLLEASLTDHAVELGALIALCTGVALFLVGSSLCHQALPNGISRRVSRAREAVAIGLVVFPFVAPTPTPLAVLAVIAGVLLALIVFQSASPQAIDPAPDVDANR